MRIDSHQHFWNFNETEFGWLTGILEGQRRDYLPSDLKPELEAAGIDGCIAVQAPQTEAETSFLLDLARESEFILGVVGWVDLRSPSLRDSLEVFARDPKFKGVRHIVQGEPSGFFADPSFRAGVRMLAEYDLTYDLLIYSHQMDEAVEFVESVPEVNLVLDHIAKPKIAVGEWEAWKARLTRLARCQNLFCKLSGLPFETGDRSWQIDKVSLYYRFALDTFGASRCMFGSDWPVSLAVGSYAQSLAAVEGILSPLERTQVMGETAARFYRVEP